MKRFTKTLPLLALAFSFNAVAQSNSLIDMNEGTYTASCSYNKDIQDDFFETELGRAFFRNGANLTPHQKNNFFAITNASLSYTFTIRDGQLIDSNIRKFSQEKFNNFTLIIESPNFDRISHSTTFRSGTEKSVYYYNLGDSSLGKLPIKISSLTDFTSYRDMDSKIAGHSDSARGAQGYINVIKSKNRPSDNNRYISDQLVSENQIFSFDPVSLKAAVLVPARIDYSAPSYSFGGGTEPGGHYFQVFRYGLLDCSIAKI